MLTGMVHFFLVPLVFDIERMICCLCQHCNNGGGGASEQVTCPVSEISTDTEETKPKSESSFFLEVVVTGYWILDAED